MALSLETPEQQLVVAQPCSVEIVVRSDQELAPGDTVEVQFPNTWMLVSGPSFTRALQSSDPDGEHFVQVQAPESAARFESDIRRRHLIYPEGICRHGRHVVATLTEGAIEPGRPIRVLYANTFAPYISERATVWLRVGGQAPDEGPYLLTTPGPAETVRIIAPSGGAPGQEFDVLIVSLDRFENASCTSYEGLTLTLDDGRVARQGLSFTGATRVRLSLDEPGVYRFWMGEWVSNALRVGEGVRGPYWGDIHIHTGLSHDGQGDDPYPYARDVSGLDFAATADHCQSMGPAGYRLAAEWRARNHEPGRFVTIPADERNPREWTGHHNIYCRTEEVLASLEETPDGTGFLHSAGPDDAPPSPEDVMVLPHHTGITFGDYAGRGPGAAVDLEAADYTGLRPVMEIYSHHGQSEHYAPQHVLAYELNRMRNPERRANASIPGAHYAQDYWKAGRRLGVIGSSDEHSGQGGRRHGGIAAVRAGELTRDGIFAAIHARRCYATTGERILLEFTVAGTPMGQEVVLSKGSTAAVRLAAWGTATLLRLEVLRFRFGVDGDFVCISSVAPRPEGLDGAVEVEDIVEGPCVYYARVAQEPLAWPGMAWTSPIWVQAE